MARGNLLAPLAIIILVCQMPTVEAKDIKIGFAHIAKNNPYYVAMEKSAADAAIAQGVQIEIQNAEGDLVKQNAQLAAMIDAGVDGIIVNSATEHGTMPNIRKAKEKNIPVVAIDRPLYGDYLAYVGIDQFKAGMLQGEYITKNLLPNGGNIVVLMGVPGEPATNGRSNGMLNALLHPKNRGKYKVLANYRADYNYDLGYQKAKEAIKSHGSQINLIYGLNDAMVLGAMKALQEARMDQVFLAGIDGQREAYIEIQKGGVYKSTVINNPSEIAKKAVEVLVAKIRDGKEPTVKNIITGTILVNKDNINQYVNPESVF